MKNENKQKEAGVEAHIFKKEIGLKSPAKLNKYLEDIPR